MDTKNTTGMMETYSHCSRFSRRHDLSIFNMGDYQSCENCTHMGADDRCIVKAQAQKNREE